MHDEGGLRPVPPDPPGSGHRQGDGGVLLLQPGPAPGPGGFRCPAQPPQPEWRPGKADGPMGGPVPETAGAQGCGGLSPELNRDDPILFLIDSQSFYRLSALAGWPNLSSISIACGPRAPRRSSEHG